jgi:alcohol dehydrogenase class IV
MGGEPDRIVADLVARLGLPAGLSALGVTDAMMQRVAEAAPKDHCHATTPRKPTVAEYLDILREAR